MFPSTGLCEEEGEGREREREREREMGGMVLNYKNEETK